MLLMLYFVEAQSSAFLMKSGAFCDSCAESVLTNDRYERS